MKNLIIIFALFLFIGAGCLGIGGADSNGDEMVQPDVRENIIVTAPGDGATVTSPIVVTGEARVYEGTVNWRLETEAGGEVAQGFFTVAADVGAFGAFEERIFIPLITESALVLTLFTYNADSGEVQDVVTRHLTVESAERVSVNVYFVDPDLQEGGDCSEVDFEKRTLLSTSNVAELAIQELLKGPESDWAVTLVPEGTTLNRISVENGVAYVDFANSLSGAWSGGSCSVLALRAQIEQTLRQFNTVQSIVISVNGETEGILEP